MCRRHRCLLVCCVLLGCLAVGIFAAGCRSTTPPTTGALLPAGRPADFGFVAAYM
jgi:hypothetical protein